jgi:hypothetical protein
MTNRKDRSPVVGDIERPRLTVADSIGDDSSSDPLTVKLGDLWSDLMGGAADQARDPEGPKASAPAVPLLDDMKGILQWD